jgi:hypothetical protein
MKVRANRTRTRPAPTKLTPEQRVEQERRIRAAVERGVPVAEIARRRRKSRWWVYQRLGSLGPQKWTTAHCPPAGNRCKHIRSLPARSARFATPSTP